VSNCAKIVVSDRTWIAAMLSLPYLLGENLGTFVKHTEVILDCPIL